MAPVAGKGAPQPQPKILPGFIAQFDNDMIVHKDVIDVGPTRRDLIELTVRHKTLVHMDVLIGGYNEDPRSLYEVPEVRRWIKIIQEKWPDWLFWLPPGSLWMVLLCLNPGMHSRLPDGRLRLAFNMETLAQQIAASHAKAHDSLKKAGMTKAELARVGSQAVANFKEMVPQKRLGEDYQLIHPDTGKVQIFRRDP